MSAKPQIKNFEKFKFQIQMYYVL